MCICFGSLIDIDNIRANYHPEFRIDIDASAVCSLGEWAAWQELIEIIDSELCAGVNVDTDIDNIHILSCYYKQGVIHNRLNIRMGYVRIPLA